MKGKAPRLVITEPQLVRFERDTERLRKAKAELQLLQAEVTAQEDELMHLLEEGAEVKSKNYLVSIDSSQQRRVVNWQSVLVSVWQQMGLNPMAERARVQAETPPTIYPHVRLEVLK